MTHSYRKTLQRRLSRIEGHVGGIRKMVKEERDCVELLIQIDAVKAALYKVGKIILEDHMESCLIEAIQSGDYLGQLAR